MFSAVVAGRLPLPAPQQVDETHAIFPLEDAGSINHVIIFMTGQQAFPPGYAATVHLNWKSQSEDKWLLLGCLKNEKPSAIFRIKGLTQQNTSSNIAAMGQAQAVGGALNTAAIGLSVETVGSVDEQMASLANKSGAYGGTDMDGSMQTDSAGDQGGSSSNALALVRPGAQDSAIQAQMALALAPKIASNIYSYLGSFAPDSAPQTVPLLKRWLEHFERKVKGQGIGFLANAEAD